MKIGIVGYGRGRGRGLGLVGVNMKLLEIILTVFFAASLLGVGFVLGRLELNETNCPAPVLIEIDSEEIAQQLMSGNKVWMTLEVKKNDY